MIKRRAAFPQRKIPPAGEIPTRGKRATFPALLSAKQTKGGRTKNARESVSPQHFSYHRKASGFRDASRKPDDPELAPTKRRDGAYLPPGAETVLISVYLEIQKVFLQKSALPELKFSRDSLSLK